MKADAEPFFRSWSASGKAGWKLWLRLVFLTPGFQLVMLLRLQRWLARIPAIGLGLRRVVWYLSTRSACDIDPQAVIGSGLYLPHPIGIVVGGGVKIGARVTILQHVTLGRSHRDSPESPIIGDDVEIGVGAVVLGPITVGDGAKIGANSVVLRDVPPGSVAVGAPARIVARAVSAPAEEE